MRIRYSFFALISVFFIFSINSFAQWESFQVPGADNIDKIVSIGDMLFVIADYNKLFISENHGESFTELTVNYPQASLKNIVEHNDILFLATNRGVYSSSDLGLTWVEKNNGFDDLSIESMSSSENYLLAANYSSVYKSENNGDNWSIIDFQPDGDFPSIEKVISHDSIDYVLAHYSWGGPAGIIYRSVDKGATWDTSFVADNYISELATSANGSFISAYVFEKFLVHSQDNGVNFTIDDYFNYTGVTNIHLVDGVIFASVGDTTNDLSFNLYMKMDVWSDISEGKNSDVGITSITDDGTYLFVSYVFDALIDRVELSELGLTTDVKNEFRKLPSSFELSQNFPNPFNPSTTISYSIPKQSHVSLKIYNVLGKEIAKLVDEEKSSGNHILEFDASNLSSGVYFYRLLSGEYNQTRKMILLH